MTFTIVMIFLALLFLLAGCLRKGEWWWFGLSLLMLIVLALLHALPKG